MRILKVIGRLLDYPRLELLTYRADLAMEISDSREISPQMRLRLLEVLGQICDGDLMDAQENYGVLFDQGRSVSLHLFEHVHGESRDRGQAMVDPIAKYAENGFELELTINKGRTDPYDLGDGYGHLAFCVDDLESEHKRLADAGYEPRKIVDFAPGGEPLARFFFIQDPDGYQIEVLQRAGRYH